MQKWCPEPFDVPEAASGATLAAATDFKTDLTDLVGTGYAEADPRQFRSEAGFTDSKSLMNSLTHEERSQVYELVELDLVEEYQAREKALRAEFENQVVELEAENKVSFDKWSTALTAIMATELKETANAAAELAVQVAAKLVRRTVRADTDVLARLIETTIYKIAEDQPLTIQANPAEAEWLAGQHELRERLHIGEVIGDRRVEAGGCLIRCGSREWDATLARQIGSLTEIVRDITATSEDRSDLAVPGAASADDPETDETSENPSTETEADDVPGLE